MPLNHAETITSQAHTCVWVTSHFSACCEHAICVASWQNAIVLLVVSSVYVVMLPAMLGRLNNVEEVDMSRNSFSWNSQIVTSLIRAKHSSRRWLFSAENELYIQILLYEFLYFSEFPSVKQVGQNFWHHPCQHTEAIRDSERRKYLYVVVNNTGLWDPIL